MSKQLPQTLSDVFAIVTVTNFYADLRIVSLKKIKELDSKKSCAGRRISKLFGKQKIFYSLVFLVCVQRKSSMFHKGFSNFFSIISQC
jgi:hypothetical protein